MADSTSTKDILIESKETLPNGMPVVDPETIANAPSKARKVTIIIAAVSTILGTLLALPIYIFAGLDSFNAKIGVMVTNDLQWAMLSALVFCKLVSHLNGGSGVYKMMIMNRDSGNLRSNMTIYRALDGNGSYITAVEDGNIGKYNRANRSLTHFLESSGGMLASFAIASYIFPIPVFVLMLIFAAGRIMHQNGYVEAYGKHGLGFVLATFSTAIIEGLLIIASAKAFALF